MSENTKLIFFGNTDENPPELECYANIDDEICIILTHKQIDKSFPGRKSVINLDRETAIKLAKELRKQISYLD